MGIKIIGRVGISHRCCACECVVTTVVAHGSFALYVTDSRNESQVGSCNWYLPLPSDALPYATESAIPQGRANTVAPAMTLPSSPKTVPWSDMVLPSLDEKHIESNIISIVFFIIRPSIVVLLQI